jgi:uncharacterized protein YndB with AHSA1/START domain
MPSAAIEAKPSLTLKRHFNAAPQTVYAAWTDPQQLMRWFGPDPSEVLSAETDVRVGGRYHITFTSGGEHHDVSGSYREVVPDRKLVFTWTWVTMPERQSLVTVTLEPAGDGTLLTLLHEQFFDAPARDRHRDGWSGSLERLARFLVAQ